MPRQFSFHIPHSVSGTLLLPGSTEVLQIGDSWSHLEEETSTTRDSVTSQKDCNPAGQAKALPCREQISLRAFGRSIISQNTTSVKEEAEKERMETSNTGQGTQSKGGFYWKRRSCF